MVFELLILLSWVSVAGSESLPSLAKQGCLQKCGDNVVFFPFGVGSKCYHNKWFEITCNNSFNPAKPYLTKLNLEVLKISLASQTVSVNMPMTVNCTKGLDPWTWRSLNLGETPFSFSRQYNRFRPVGCRGTSLSYYENQIMANCGDPVCGVFAHGLAGHDLGYEYTSEGYYCEVKRPPNGITSYCVNITEANGTCHYVYFADSDLNTGYQFNGYADPTPVVLNWLYDLSLNPLSALYSGGHCDFSAYMETGVYTCSCPDRQAGNPYLPNDCRKIKECAKCVDKCYASEVYSDSDDVSKRYYCKYHGPHPRIKPRLLVGIIVTIGSILIFLGWYWLYQFIKRYTETKMEIGRKANNFKRNGGLLLEQQISSNQSAIEGTKVFTSNELETATDHFNINRILGQGGQGTVYKGMLVDGRIVAVKKAKKVGENQLEQFINEMVILSQLNHRHIVKLLGCCLETDVPLLVYEYIPNGTLFNHIHDPPEEFPFTWKMRLQIASDVAGAVAYLHSASSIPIYHRDIKSSNILLDDKYKAKVSDFGISRTISIDQTHLTTCVQGTFGYLDPEYFRSHQLTEKSDVYSFGVVLVELLTGQRPIRSESEEERSLVGYFLSSVENSCLFDIVDNRVVMECCEEVVLAFASLARWCLHLNGKQRPTMKEVVTVLEGIKLRQDRPSTGEEPSTRLEVGEVMGEDYVPFSSFSDSSVEWGSSSPFADHPLITNTS